MLKDPRRLPPLDLLVSFDAAARHLSFTLAGAERFVTQSAISRQMRALERDLGVALFRRQHRALTLTDEGRRLHEVCNGALGSMRNAVAQLRAPRRREVLSLSTTPGLASLWLIPRLPKFTAAQPGIDVRIDATSELRDLTSAGIDIAIRYGPIDGNLGKPMLHETTLPVCSPKLLRRPAPPLRTPVDLRRHTLLQFVLPPRPGMLLEWGTWLQAIGLGDLQPVSVLTFTSYSEAISAALAGQGVALGRRPLVDELIRSRQLVAPFKDGLASRYGFFLLVEPNARARPAVRALEQWLIAQASA